MNELSYLEGMDRKTDEGRIAIVERLTGDTITDADAYLEVFHKRHARIDRVVTVRNVYNRIAIDYTPFGIPFVRPEFREFGPLGVLLTAFDGMPFSKLKRFAQALDEVKALRDERRAREGAPEHATK